MASTEQSWAPPPGRRHQVNIGSSLSRALKARRGLPSRPNKNLPVNDFYLFRYNFKPESVDCTRPGVVEVSQAQDNASTVRVERASHQADEVHIFRGKEEPAKEFDCVLIYNEEDGMFTLEKLDSSLSLTYDGRSHGKLPSPSPLPTPSPAPPTPAPKIEQTEEDLQEELDRELLTTLIEEDEPVRKKPKPIPTPARKVEPEEEDIPLQKQTQAKPKPKPTKPKLKGKEKVTSSAPATPATKTEKPSKGKGKPHIDADEEDLEFGQPTKPMKVTVKAKSPPPPPPPAPLDLALPTSGGDASVLPVLPGAADQVQDQDFLDLVMEEVSGDEWEPVVGTEEPVAAQQPNTPADEGSIFGGEGEEAAEEIDLGDFEAQMNAELEFEEGDPEAQEYSEASVVTGKPLPMSALLDAELEAQLAEGLEEEDDYSSSEDSDDD